MKLIRISLVNVFSFWRASTYFQFIKNNLIMVSSPAACNLLGFIWLCEVVFLASFQLETWDLEWFTMFYDHRYIRLIVVEALRLYPQPPLLIRRTLKPDSLPGTYVRCIEQLDLCTWERSRELDVAQMGVKDVHFKGGNTWNMLLNCLFI